IRSELLGTTDSSSATRQPLRFRFSGSDYMLALAVRERDADARQLTWENFKLVGEVKGQVASFVLTGDVVVRHPEGGRLVVLSGEAALTSVPPDAEVKYEF